ncbi:MAG: hypothetical protein A3I77_05470 [Gammaproteobacteria bacterium RIFCSPLOWO2_02_FULL_42_14]|nr:MAG: hypothetical protein A3E54_03225 [Gammaproteobacteria bacterium RIFCSPHIGHO2_12_FULL_41_25]OGT62982.1 MAG: hypothetical protein A3I77_05470 [Gammaproteobacteria bacterium RIFCSPLOWO2_02_FULL_42_14]OGT86115.1 MAG: hypothetical protein A3G86_03025 [Gammaproteobacteria bacterium RIFCSPLOWO2_12_FULL_42_18]
MTRYAMRSELSTTVVEQLNNYIDESFETISEFSEELPHSKLFYIQQATNIEITREKFIESLDTIYTLHKDDKNVIDFLRALIILNDIFKNNIMRFYFQNASSDLESEGNTQTLPYLFPTEYKTITNQPNDEAIANDLPLIQKYITDAITAKFPEVSTPLQSSPAIPLPTLLDTAWQAQIDSLPNNILNDVALAIRKEEAKKRKEIALRKLYLQQVQEGALTTLNNLVPFLEGLTMEERIALKNAGLTDTSYEKIGYQSLLRSKLIQHLILVEHISPDDTAALVKSYETDADLETLVEIISDGETSLTSHIMRTPPVSEVAPDRSTISLPANNTSRINTQRVATTLSESESTQPLNTSQDYNRIIKGYQKGFSVLMSILRNVNMFASDYSRYQTQAKEMKKEIIIQLQNAPVGSITFDNIKIIEEILKTHVSRGPHFFETNSAKNEYLKKHQEYFLKNKTDFKHR